MPGPLGGLTVVNPLNQPPSVIAIEHDDHHARHVGRTVDGRQFLVTTPFIPADRGHPGREFIAVYIFDSEVDSSKRASTILARAPTLTRIWLGGCSNAGWQNSARSTLGASRCAPSRSSVSALPLA